MARTTSSWVRRLLPLATLLLSHIPNTSSQATEFLDMCKDPKETITISSLDQLTWLAPCKTIKGDLVLHLIESVEVTLFGIQNIEGQLQIHLANSTYRFAAPMLKKVGKVLSISGDQSEFSELRVVEMPEFNTAGGIDLSFLPKLTTLEFPARVNHTEPATTLSIANTGLEGVDKMNLDYYGIQNIALGGNPSLKTVELNVGRISVALDINGMGTSPNISMPELTYLTTANLHDISGLELDSLEAVGGALGIYNSPELKTLNLPSLKAMGVASESALVITNNTGLVDVSFPALETINGGITVEDNDSWRRLNSFPKLSQVTQDIAMIGVFTLVEFPSLYDIEGKFFVKSTSGLSFDCADLQKMNTDTQKTFTCGTSVNRDTGEDPAKVAGEGDVAGLTGPKITGIAIGCLAAVITPLLLIRYFLVRKRKKALAEKGNGTYGSGRSRPRELNHGSRGRTPRTPRTPTTPGGGADSDVEFATAMPAKMAQAKIDHAHHQANSRKGSIRSSLDMDDDLDIQLDELEREAGYRHGVHSRNDKDDDLEISQVSLPSQASDRNYRRRNNSSDTMDDYEGALTDADEMVKPKNMIS